MNYESEIINGIEIRFDNDRKGKRYSWEAYATIEHNCHGLYFYGYGIDKDEAFSNLLIEVENVSEVLNKRLEGLINALRKASNQPAEGGR